MPELLFLPSTTYQPPSDSQARRTGRSLNTILEEENEDLSSSKGAKALGRRRRSPPPPPANKYDNIELWLSPISDNFSTPKGFPTPRGTHFLAAPILPSSPSAASADDTISPATSPNPWNRASVSTDVTEFDDLYDLSDEEGTAGNPKMPRNSTLLKRRSTIRSASSRRSSVDSRRSLPPLAIPNAPVQAAEASQLQNQQWVSMPGLKALASPCAPTPTATVEMSPAVRHLMQTQELPTISAPPSLDGSLSSEQMAAMSAPPTPIIGYAAKDDEEWNGIQLQPAALATLQALSGDNDQFYHHDDSQHDDYQHEQPSQVIEVPQAPSIPMEMRQQPARVVPSLSRPSSLSFEQHQSLEGLTRLEIPSPGGFFAALSPRARHTWHMPTPDDAVPPTSTTAEQFYRTPWNNPSPALSRVPSFPMPPARKISPLAQQELAPPIEQVVEVPEDEIDEDNVPTAKPTIVSNLTEVSSAASEPEGQPQEEVVPTEIVVDYDPDYARKQQEVALSNLDRTEMWLMAQKVYMGGVMDEDSQSESGKTEDTDAEVDAIELEIAPPVPPKSPEPVPAKAEDSSEVTTALSPPQHKKTVRFSELPKPSEGKVPKSLPSKFHRQESAYYRSFQDNLVKTHNSDALVNSLPRFEALQADRIALPDQHRAQLLGKYQLSVVPQSAKKRMSANVARGDDDLVDDPARLQREKEHEAERQMAPAAWAVGASKRLDGDKFLLSPAGKFLARQSMMLINGKYKGDRLRILDLGGMAACDWAWHVAHAYPNAKVYTAALRSQRQLSNANVRGPPNHRAVTVNRLTTLPFPNNYFDVISARELHSALHFSGENGADEWELALQEAMRVLKPGGYFEFSLMDSDIVNPGPQGLAKSVEFGFVLNTLGYDPSPTRSFIGRLNRAGFEGVKRGWTVLPMGARPTRPELGVKIRDSTVDKDVQTCKIEAIVEGSTDAAAPVTGLVGSWVWERWLLRAETEKVAGDMRLSDVCAANVKDGRVKEAGRCLDGVAGVVEEGRRNGSGWRVLKGYARKPE